MLRLVVQPGEDGDGRTDGKTVTVPAVERLAGSRNRESGQDIDVDLRDLPRCVDGHMQCWFRV